MPQNIVLQFMSVVYHSGRSVYSLSSIIWGFHCANIAPFLLKLCAIILLFMMTTEDAFLKFYFQIVHVIKHSYWMFSLLLSSGSSLCIMDENPLINCFAAKLCPTLCDLMDCRPPGSVHGILQATILEWVVISYSRATTEVL